MDDAEEIMEILQLQIRDLHTQLQRVMMESQAIIQAMIRASGGEITIPLAYLTEPLGNLVVSEDGEATHRVFRVQR